MPILFEVLLPLLMLPPLMVTAVCRLHSTGTFLHSRVEIWLRAWDGDRGFCALSLEFTNQEHIFLARG